MKYPLLLTLFCCTQLLAQANLHPIDSLLVNQYPTEGPGAVFLISRGDSVLYERAFGEANIELQVPMAVDNVFQIGSITKQFTAFAVMLLVQEGKIDPARSVVDYLPEVPESWQGITLHHLLTHTSGLKDFTRLSGLNEFAKSPRSVEEVIAFFSGEAPDFVPGTQYTYCNAGYILLGAVIEKVSGQPYEDFIETRIFQALGMADSRYWHPEEIVPRRAEGYLCREACRHTPPIDPSVPYASGALLSTVRDLHTWNRAVMDHRLLNAEHTAKLFQPYVPEEDEAAAYGYGWHLRTIGETMSFQHGGDIFGYKSMAVYLPSLDIYIVGLTNCNCNSPTQVVRKIAEICLR